MSDDWAPPEADFKAAAWAPPDADFAAASPPAPSPDETAGRIAGLAGRATIKGAGDLAGVIPTAVGAIGALADPGGAEIDRAVQASAGPYKPQLSDFVHPERWQQAAEYFSDRAADKAGLPTPLTAPEKIGSRAIEALPSAALMPEAPIAGAIGAALGSGTSEAVKQAGGAPWAQTAAGLAAGSIPALASNSGAITRRILGGDSGEEAQGRIATATQNKTGLTAGQATGSPVLQKLESASGALWGGGPIQKAAQARAASLDNHISDIVDNLTPPGETLSPMSAGTAINKGIEATKKSMGDAEDAAYDKVDALVPPTTPVDVSKSLATARSLANPTSKPALNQAVASPGISKFSEALENSSAAPQEGLGPLPAPTLSYSDLSQLRSAVGQKIDRGFAPANPQENGAYKKLWGALTQDKNNGAETISPEAKDAVQQANSLYAQNSAQRENLNAIIQKSAGGPEALYNAATGKMKDGSTIIGRVMGAIGPDEQNLVRATVLDRMGRAVANSQDATGSVFNPETFLTKWGNMSDEAKDSLFGASGASGDLRSNLDSFTSTLSTLRQSGALKNPSGTAPLIGHAIGAANMMSDIMIGLFTGHPVAFSGLALPVVNNIAARSLTNPTVVKWLAQSAKLPRSALPNAVNQLSQINDPDAQNLAGYLAAASQSPPDRTQRASGGKVDIDSLVERLIKRWKAAKKVTDESTKPLLHQPDAAIVKALDIAQQHI